MSTDALGDYLEHAKIYKGSSSNKKTDLVEMIVYIHITDTICKTYREDISENKCKQILRQNRIQVRSLPGYGNIGLKRKEIIECSNSNSECAVRVVDLV